MQLGKDGEELAAAFLENSGMLILDRNYHSPNGEIDIIGKHGEQIIFFEIKTRTSEKYGYPEESITPKKIKALIDTATRYLQEHDLLEHPWRIDVISILMENDEIQYKWFKNAVTC